MLGILLAKDLRRVWRNPLPALVNLTIPLLITALIGFAFGNRSDDDPLDHIKFAVVDEDDSALTGMLRGMMNQREASKHLEPVFLDRDEALKQINEGAFSAVLIIPTNFTRDFFDGEKPVSIELIKNPAQSIQPAMLEEMTGAVVTGLNALARNFHSQFPYWRMAFEGNVDYHDIATYIDEAGKNLDAVKKYVNPPLVSYEKPDEKKKEEKKSAKTEEKDSANDQKQDSKQAKDKPKEQKKSYLSQVFAFVLPGMAGMFLLFLAGNAMTDLQRELRFRTFERFQTLRASLLPFVVGKVVYVVVFLLICSVILLGLGGLIFRIEWTQPLALAVMSSCYCFCVAGIMALMVAFSPDERHGATMNSIVGIVLGLAGACTFPRNQLPHFIGDHITPLLPSFWFVDTARSLQDGDNSAPWRAVSIQLVVLGIVLVAAAVFFFQRRFKRGLRA